MKRISLQKLCILFLCLLSLILIHTLYSIKKSSGNNLPIQDRDDTITTEEYQLVNFDPIDQLMNKRRQRIQRICRRYSEATNNFALSSLANESKKYILVDKRHKVLFCRIPFANSLVWKRFFIALNAKIPRNEIPELLTDEKMLDDGLHWPELVEFHRLDEGEKSEILKEYTKILVVRDVSFHLI